MSGRQTISAFNSASLPAIQRALAADEVAVLDFDGSTVTNEASFTRQFAIDIDLDAANESAPRTWDVLHEVLRGVLAAQNNDHVVLLWRHADVMLTQSINEFLIAIAVLTSTAQSALSRTVGTGMIRFQVILLGDTPMFPDFDPFA